MSEEAIHNINQYSKYSKYIDHLKNIHIFSFFISECYQVLSSRRRLVEPSVTKSFNAEREEECRHACDEAEFTCVAFSFG